MTEPTKIKIFFQAGDTPFIVWAHGPISSNMLASIESDIEKDPPNEFQEYGDGIYCYDAQWDSGQYDEYGRCEFQSGWELTFTAFEKMTPEAGHGK